MIRYRIRTCHKSQKEFHVQYTRFGIIWSTVLDYGYDEDGPMNFGTMERARLYIEDKLAERADRCTYSEELK